MCLCLIFSFYSGFVHIHLVSILWQSARVMREFRWKSRFTISVCKSKTIINQRIHISFSRLDFTLCIFDCALVHRTVSCIFDHFHRPFLRILEDFCATDKLNMIKERSTNQTRASMGLNTVSITQSIERKRRKMVKMAFTVASHAAFVFLSSFFTAFVRTNLAEIQPL